MSQTLLKGSTLKILQTHRISFGRCLIASNRALGDAAQSSKPNNELIKNTSLASSRLAVLRPKQNMLGSFGGLGISWNNRLGFTVDRAHARFIHNSALMRFKDDDSKKNNDETSDQAPGSSDPSDPPGGDGGGPTLPIPSLVALAPLQIPDFLPRVPVIAINRNPLFPFFIKMLEVRITKFNRLFFLIIFKLKICSYRSTIRIKLI